MDNSLPSETTIKKWIKNSTLPANYTVWGSIRRLFLLNGYNVTFMTNRDRSLNWVHPLSNDYPFPFEFNLEVTKAQKKWVKIHPISLISLKK